MAEAARPRPIASLILQELEDLIECSIHRGTYENPRQLPCLHSFCLQCLVNYTKDKPPANNIICPLCRKEITVPDDGIEGFPRNFIFEKIIDIKRLTGQLQTDTLCDICKEDEDLTSDIEPVASMFCAECRKNLCDRCTKEHRRQNKSHSVLKMGSEEISEQLVKKLEVSFCNYHSEKVVEMFCFDCQIVICKMCFDEMHILHNCSDVNNSAKEFRQQIEREIDEISIYLSEGKKMKEIIDKRKMVFLQEIKRVEENIFERSEEWRRYNGDWHYIDRDRNLLLGELKIIKSSHLKEMQIKDDEIQRHLAIIVSLKIYGEKIVTVGSAIDICRSANQFSMRAQEVQATLKAASSCGVIYRSVSFHSAGFQEKVKGNILGELNVHCEAHLAKNLNDPEKSLGKTLTECCGNKDTTTTDEGLLTDEHITMTSKQREQIRKLKSPTPGDDALVEADAHSGLAERRVDGDIVRVLVEKTSTSHKNLQSDVIDKHSHSTEGQSTQEAVQESLPKPKRVRKLKSPTRLVGDTSNKVDAQSGLAGRRVEDARILVEEMKTLDESGDEVTIEVDRDRHHYLMTHFGDEVKKKLPPFKVSESEEGKHKVNIVLNSKRKGGEDITSTYNSYLSRFHFEVVRVPYGIDGSLLHSLVSSYEEKLSSSFVFDEDNRICKLIGKKKEVDKIKKLIEDNTLKLIEDNTFEQLKTSQDTEGKWVVAKSKKKGNKTASIINFSMEHGKLNRFESSQTPATKKCSLQVNLYEFKTKASATEAIVRAIDSKMQSFGDAKAAIEFESGKKFKDECRKIMNGYYNSVPFGEVVHTITGDTQQRTKVKYIVHIVLEENKASASPAATMKDVIYRCLHYADNELQIKSLSFPHLGGTDYCDIGSFVRASIEALQSFASTAHHLQRVCFIVKDSKTLQDLADEFEKYVDDNQHNTQLTPSSE